MANKKKANSAKTELQKIQENNNKTTIELQKLANANTAKTFEYNTKEAQASRAWQTEMSNTSHQREVADLKAAGLNPVLSSNQGAQSYVTSSASAQADNSAVSAVAGIKQSETNARSSMYGADQSYKASQAVASAQRYAADRAYQSALASAAAARYSADKHYEAQKYSADKSYEAVMNKPVSSVVQLADKYLGQATKSALSDILKGDSVVSSVRNSSKWNAVKIADSANAYTKLTSAGQARARAILSANNIAINSVTMSYMAGFVITGNVNFLKRLAPYKFNSRVHRYYK